jgi:alcohol dehydrogenase (cytochrome c)
VLASSASAQVSYERLLKARTEPGSWLTYSGTYDAQRYSPLDLIRPENVATLRPAWVYQATQTGPFEATPLVADGVMYLTEPRGPVVALDARTGRSLWRWDPVLPKDLRTLGFGPANRGVALLDGTVFVGTLDARLVALDAVSGAVRWTARLADNKLGYAITSAPLAIDGQVVIGVSGGEAGIRGFLDSYDARTGERRWRFVTIPGPGEPGHETWTGDSWKTGGGPTWLSGSYDPDLDLLYWGVGNPGPDWNGDARPGDNLYTCSLVALEAKTGRLRWYFQFTPHDTHDWDANQVPVLLDAEVAGDISESGGAGRAKDGSRLSDISGDTSGKPRRLVLLANRNAFYYVLDRTTGEFLRGVPYAKQTWAQGLDAKGRPIAFPGQEPSEKGTLTWPSLQGATNWFSPSYSPKTGLFYVSVREMGSTYYKGEVTYVPGAYFMGGGESMRPGEEAYGAVRGLDALTGETRWEFRLLSPPWSGLLATGGGLVFGGSPEGNIYALDAATGRALWSFQTGGGMASNPMSYLLEGRQHVAMAAGNALFVFALP